MAELAERLKENVTGRYYVDATCIDCERCREVAPGHFTRQDEGRYSFVYAQPANEGEEAACRQAMDECPVEAIGNDGAGAA